MRRIVKLALIALGIRIVFEIGRAYEKEQAGKQAERMFEAAIQSPFDRTPFSERIRNLPPETQRVIMDLYEANREGRRM